MARSKLMLEADAIRRFVEDGDVIYAGYTTVAFGLCHEIIRQRKRGLDIVGGSVGGQGSLLFLAGCADRARTGLEPLAAPDAFVVGGGEAQGFAEGHGSPSVVVAGCRLAGSRLLDLQLANL